MGYVKATDSLDWPARSSHPKEVSCRRRDVEIEKDGPECESECVDCRKEGATEEKGVEAEGKDGMYNLQDPTSEMRRGKTELCALYINRKKMRWLHLTGPVSSVLRDCIFA